MFEHPHYTHQITRYEQEQMERAAAQRLFLLEHADQIVPRRAGTVRRMLRRIVGAADERTTTARTAPVCDPTAVAAR